MKEYQVKGMSCGGCAMRLEQEIRELDHGEDATLSYNSGKLKVNGDISLDAVRRILKSDGASLVAIPDGHANGNGQEHSHRRPDGHTHADTHGHTHADDHGHEHSHGGGLAKLKPVLAAAVLYASTLLVDGWAEPPIAILLYLAATAISGYPTFMKGLRNLLKLKFTMDTLMTVALIGAVAIGEWKEATLVAILFGLNEWLEGLGMEKARRSMDALLKTAPKEALKVEDGRESIVPISALSAGDIVRIKPGVQIPSDGVVVEGISSVNEAAITGESLPLDKSIGEPVFGGSLNQDGMLLVRITKAYEDSSLARILHLVQEAQETKTPTELFINKFARYYTPAIMIIAALVILIPPLLLGGEWKIWLYQGLSVLIVGCPCALILASPIAIVSGIARMARHGILVKGGVYLEQLGKLDMIAFDKTGTLTKGEPHVTESRVYDEDRLFRIAGMIEGASSHPLAKAVLKETERRGIRVDAAPASIQNIAGVGMEAVIEGRAYRLGNEKSAAHLALPQEVIEDIEALKAAGLTLVIVSDETDVLGLFGIEDEVREESPAVIAALHRLGIRKTVMLTGDHARTAQKVARQVGVTEAKSGLLPEDKVTAIRALSAEGRVAMVGDGVNDAPALAAAGLGIAMGKGTDSAMETADIVLMQDHLGKLPYAVKIARHAGRIIRLNIAIALGLKLIALLLTIPGWLTLWIAILSDMGATILVTLIGLTMFAERKERVS
ncbi:heavy metal translocating P-type ATPase [Paenibacillus sp. LHD-117]|uniref:heavy metal translocating P-type ATPase n=1 Tax=Paenibacillus sp. LHD-117 TaxID=3071412 RepID=UPI0027E0D327|nr:heavy metal translocating P-type ATPase [Paenibacillus sp. LHD-117]MDQ6419797.1 heavy metal translocating P-type ATPase [Paenibacillus sp. LHD-117]